MTFLIFKILTFWLFICRDGPDAYYRKYLSNNEKMEMASKRMGEVRTCSTSTNFPSWCWWCSCMILHGWCLSETIIICGECGSDGSHHYRCWMLSVGQWWMATQMTNGVVNSRVATCILMRHQSLPEGHISNWPLSQA